MAKKSNQMISSVNIPKVIHYCWFGGNPLPELAIKCIESWKKYLPDYEIKRWDESNFDVNIIPYTQQAYEAKKYAFVSDYARLWILYNYGGLYFDTDVELIKPMADIIAAGPFMGCENPFKKNGLPASLGVNPGLGLGTNSGHEFYKQLLDLYSNLKFYKPNGALNTKTIVEYTTELLCKKGLLNTPDIQIIDDIYIYPKEYFCPQDYQTGIIHIQNETRSIHHYSASWLTKKDKLKIKISNILGPHISKICANIIYKIKYLKIYGRKIPGD